MASPDILTRYGARLLVEWLNRRSDASFDISETQGEAFVASDGEYRIGVYVAPLWEREASAEWEERLRDMEARLNSGGPESPFLLWAPPKADVPSEEPDASDFVQQVQAAAESLPPAASTEVLVPVNVRLGKTRSEGGYASVVGGMSRWWTRITEKVNGTFHVDSSAVHRLTIDGESRERLWDSIGQLSYSIEVGQSVDFEVQDAWTLQRLPESEAGAGFAIVGAPPTVDPTEGILVRRMARRRLIAANEALDALDVDLRAVGLFGIYEYAELEGAGATVKGLDPKLFSRLEIVSVLVDGEMRATFFPRSLPWAGQGSSSQPSE